MFSLAEEKDTLQILLDTADALSAELASSPFEWDEALCMKFRDNFIRAVSHPYHDVTLTLTELIATAHLRTFVWCQKDHMKSDAWIKLLQFTNNRIAASDWIHDKAACITKINDMKQYLTVKEAVHDWIDSALKRIKQYRYPFFMSNESSERKVSALIIVLLQLEATSNMDELCEVIYGGLLNNSHVLGARAKFALTQEEMSQTKCDLKHFIRVYDLTAKMDAIAMKQSSLSHQPE